MSWSKASTRSCSTPYGIRGSAVGNLRNLAHRPMRAQRLTASEVQQILRTGSVNGASWCSTPYGIRGSAVAVYDKSKKYHIVLNALRHQRFSSSPPRRGWFFIAVLNALRHQRFSRHPIRSQHSNSYVLNALRHQRFSSIV